MKSTEQILTIMHVIAWIAFIGLTVQAVAIMISYAVSWSYPEAAKDLYMSMDLYQLMKFNFWHYTQAVSLIVTILCMKAYVVYQVIEILSKVNLKSPFTVEVADKLETISYILFGIWLISVIQHSNTTWLIKRAAEVERGAIAQEFLFISGLVYIISKIFKRGIEMQSENELTV